MLVATLYDNCVDLEMFSEVHVGEGSGVKVVSSAKAVRKVGGVAAGCADRQQVNHIHMSSLLLNSESSIIKGIKKQKWLCVTHLYTK